MSLAKDLKALECPSDIKFTVIRVNAQQAQELLDKYNIDNRFQRGGNVKAIANDILMGRWTNQNGEVAIFGEYHEDDVPGGVVEYIISFQHRLKGVIAAQKEWESYLNDEERAVAFPDATLDDDGQLFFETCAVFGVTAITDSIDQTQRRDHKDVLSRDPWVQEKCPESWQTSDARYKKWCTMLATATRVVWQRCGGKTVASAQKFDTNEMLAFLKEQHSVLPELVTMVIDADDGDGGAKGIPAFARAYLAGLGYMACYDAEDNFDQDTFDRLDVACNNLSVLSGYDKGSPEWALQCVWTSLPSGSKNRDTMVCGPIVKFMNALLDGTEEGLKPSAFKLSKKEADNYASNPPLIQGYDEACAVFAVEAAAEPGYVEVVEEEPVVEEPEVSPEEQAQQDAEAAMASDDS